MCVSPAAIAAFAEDDAFAVVDYLGYDLFGSLVDYDRAERHLHLAGLPLATVAIGALPVLSALRFPVRLVFIIDEIVDIVTADQNDVAAPASIATVRAAPRLILFAAETDAATAAVAGLNFNNAFVDEHGKKSQ